MEEKFTENYCVCGGIMWEERMEDMLGYLCEEEGVKTWFGLRPEQDICLDVTVKGDDVSSSCLPLLSLLWFIRQLRSLTGMSW